jgi:hypothetical protein
LNGERFASTLQKVIYDEAEESANLRQGQKNPLKYLPKNGDSTHDNKCFLPLDSDLSESQEILGAEFNDLQ